MIKKKRKLNRDTIENNKYDDYLNKKPLYNLNMYPENNEEITHQSRATHPAWELREINSIYDKTTNNESIPNNFNYLHMNPQQHICIPFQNNISSRIVEKDYYNINNNK